MVSDYPFINPQLRVSRKLTVGGTKVITALIMILNLIPEEPQMLYNSLIYLIPCLPHRRFSKKL